MRSIVRTQRPCFTCSAASTAKTACSARVNRDARAGGKAPAEAQRRRLSREAGVLGRDPKRRWAGFGVAGSVFLASIASLRSAASDSLTAPAAYAFHNSAEIVGNSARGDA